MISNDDIIKHYRTPKIMETILRVSESGGFFRWANGDRIHWYRTWGKKPIPMTESNYKELAGEYRTLYTTLSYFQKRVFDTKFKDLTEDEKSDISREHVVEYTIGIDIDTVDEINGHGVNIRDPKVKEAVEAAAQFFSNKLREHAPSSVYCLFSGGGIYVLLHHEVLKTYFIKIARYAWDDYIRSIKTLTEAINLLTKVYEKEFFEEHPEYKKYVKIDHINNAKRIFKTIFSIHRTHDFAVIPIDPKNIKINFDDATIPLKKEVIETGENWYTEYDNTDAFFIELSPYLKQAEDQMDRWKANKTEFQISEGNHNCDEYPPCIRNILNRESCGAGATRALTFLATFLGHIEPDKSKAYQMWSDVADRWNADTSNIFESHYGVMHCASCATLNTQKGGFPHVDITEIGACKPDLRCQQIRCSNPIYYTDKKMYIEKLKADFLKN